MVLEIHCNHISFFSFLELNWPILSLNIQFNGVIEFLMWQPQEKKILGKDLCWIGRMKDKILPPRRVSHVRWQVPWKLDFGGSFPYQVYKKNLIEESGPCPIVTLFWQGSRCNPMQNLHKTWPKGWLWMAFSIWQNASPLLLVTEGLQYCRICVMRLRSKVSAATPSSY